MAVLPKVLMWRPFDAAGTEQVLIDDTSGLHARGALLRADPVPFCCRYELYTDDTWTSVHFDATAEGAGFLRTVRLERASGRLRVTASEQGDLDATLRAAGRAPAGMPGTEEVDQFASALDVDLAYSPLTNTLPIRRLGLLDAPPGTSHELSVAWVLLPSLEVVHSVQTYTVTGPSSVRYASGTFTAELSLDTQGYVTRYPELADRV